jgi:tryptophan 2,3-dioxygenase
MLPAEAQANVRVAEAKRTLREQVDGWLKRTPFVDMGKFNFHRAYRAAYHKMLAQDEAAARSNTRLLPGDKERKLASIQNSRVLLNEMMDEKEYTKRRKAGGWTFSRRALQAALFIFLYRDEPATNAAFRMLKALMDIDETLALWRMRHALMVSRMLGRKVGSGGSSGYDYLRQTAEDHRVYNDLFTIATFLIPRSALPKLPLKVRKSMRYGYDQKQRRKQKKKQ